MEKQKKNQNKTKQTKAKIPSKVQNRLFDTLVPFYLVPSFYSRKIWQNN